MQEQIEEKTAAISVKAVKMTGQLLGALDKKSLTLVF